MYNMEVGEVREEVTDNFCFYVLCVLGVNIEECKYIKINYTILKRDISRLSFNNMYI